MFGCRLRIGPCCPVHAKACAARVEAVDVGEQCIANTRKRIAADASRLNVTRASVLNLPFPR